MPRKCTVCNSKSVEKVNEALLKRKSFRQIASHYRLGYRSVTRHYHDCLCPLVKEAFRKGKAGDLKVWVERQLKDTEDLIESAKDALRDTRDPSKFSMNPDAWDFDVDYDFDTDKGGTSRRTESLQSILHRIGKKGYHWIRLSLRRKHPVDIWLQALRELRSSLEFLAKMAGEIENGMNVTVELHTEDLKKPKGAGQ